METEDYRRLAKAPHPVEAHTLHQVPSAVKGLLEQLTLKQREVSALEYAIWTLQNTCPHTDSPTYRSKQTDNCPRCGCQHCSRESIDDIYAD